MSTRIRNQRGEGERLRGALLDAASELLAELQDVERLSVRAITRRAGVSPTALYLHFADKEELTREVKTRCFAAFDAALADAAGAADDPRERVRAMGRAYLRFAREQPGQYAILFHTNIAKEHPVHNPGDPSPQVPHFGLLVDAVEQAVEPGRDAFGTACVLWMALHGRAAIATAMPSFPFPDEERYLARLVDGQLG